MKIKTFSLFLVLLICALIFVQSAGAMSSDHFRLDWYTLMNGAGGGRASSTNCQTNLTIGQTVIQHSSSANYRASTGYWFGVLQRWFQHLPLIVNVGP